MKIVIPSKARSDIQFTVRELIRAKVPRFFECFLIVLTKEKEEYAKFNSN